MSTIIPSTISKNTSARYIKYLNEGRNLQLKVNLELFKLFQNIPHSTNPNPNPTYFLSNIIQYSWDVAWTL